MVGGMKNHFPVIPALLVLLVLLCLVGGGRNYNALLNSDQYAYLIYGRSLARGGFAVEYPLIDIMRERLGPDTEKSLHYGRRHYADGTVISILELGFPLLLAAAISLAGLPAAFGVNVVLLGILIIAYFLVLRDESPGFNLTALAAVFIFLGLDDHIAVGYSLIVMRDIPAVALFWLSLCLMMTSLRRPRPFLPGLLAAVAVLAFSSLVRLTNLVFIPLLALYALIIVRRSGLSWIRIGIWSVAAAAVFFLTFLPQMIEEASVITGRPLAFAGRALTAFEGFFSRVPRGSIHVFSLENLRNNLPKNLADLSYTLTLPGLFFIVAGVFVCRRRLSTWLIMLPVPLIALLLFSSFGYRAHRYHFPLYPFIAYFAAAGAIGLLSFWRNFQTNLTKSLRLISGFAVVAISGVGLGWRLSVDQGLNFGGIFFIALGLSALLSALPSRRAWWNPAPGVVFSTGVGLILLPFMLGLITERRNFSWQDAQHLRREIESCVPADAVVLGSRYLIQNVDIYTHAHGISPGNLTAPLGVDLAEAVNIVGESGRPVFALDNRGVNSMESDIRHLRRYFDLEPVCRWRSAEFKLKDPYYSNEEELTLYRVNRRRRTELLLTLPTVVKADHLALLDAGLSTIPGVRPDGTLVKVNGRELAVEFTDGLNYLLVAAGDVSIPETVIEVSASRPLPSDPLYGFRRLGRSFRVDFGVDRVPDDELFVVCGLYLGRARRRPYRVMGPEAEILLPRLVPPGGAGWLKLRIRNMLPGGLPLNLAIQPGAGRIYGRTIPPGREWMTVKCPVPALSPRQGSFVLKLVAEPVTADREEREGLKNSAFLAIDWLEIRWREDGPESSGDE